MTEPWQAQLRALRDADINLTMKVNRFTIIVDAQDAGNAWAYVVQDQVFNSIPEAVETVYREWQADLKRKQEAA